jgi:hypothetical protein
LGVDRLKETTMPNSTTAAVKAGAQKDGPAERPKLRNARRVDVLLLLVFGGAADAAVILRRWAVRTSSFEANAS